MDYECSVWLNGRAVGGHQGGHVPFDIDLTEAIQAVSGGASSGDEGTAREYRVTMRVRDSPYDLEQPRGKQYWKPVSESIFYTPTSGIWQTVWLESVPAMRLADSSGGTVLRSDDIDAGILRAHVAVAGRPANRPCTVEIESSLKRRSRWPRHQDPAPSQSVCGIGSQYARGEARWLGRCRLRGVALEWRGTLGAEPSRIVRRHLEVMRWRDTRRCGPGRSTHHSRHAASIVAEWGWHFCGSTDNPSSKPSCSTRATGPRRE